MCVHIYEQCGRESHLFTANHTNKLDSGQGIERLHLHAYTREAQDYQLSTFVIASSDCEGTCL